MKKSLNIFHLLKRSIGITVLVIIMALLRFVPCQSATYSGYVGDYVSLPSPSIPSGAKLISGRWYELVFSGDLGFRNMADGSAQVLIKNYFTDRRLVWSEYSYRLGDDIYSGGGSAYIQCNPINIQFNPSTIQMSTGEQVQLKYTLNPSKSVSLQLDFTSSNTGVASVIGDGYVYANGRGTATITVTSNVGPPATCTVIVSDVEPTGVDLTTSLPIAIGQTVTLEAKLTPENAVTDFTWSSSDTAVATVDSRGKVTGKNEGNTIITVKTSNGLSASCSVSVYKAVPSNIELKKKAIALPVGSSELLTFDVTPIYAVYTLSWASNDDTVAEVDSFGKVTAKQTGLAVITVATDNGKSSSCEIRVYPQPNAIELSKKKLDLALGKSVQIAYTLLPDGAMANTVTWTSSEPLIYSVSQDGIVTAHKPGSSVITATTDNGCEGRCEVTVNIPHYSFVVWTNNSVKTAYDFYNKPVITINDTVFTVASQTKTVKYNAKDIIKFTIENASVKTPGDVNGDMTIDVADIATVISIMAGKGINNDTISDNNTVRVLTVDPVNVQPGYTSEIVVKMDYETTEKIHSWSGVLYLPDGISFMYDEDGEIIYEISHEILPKSVDISFCPRADGSYLFFGVNASLIPIKGTHGELLRIPIIAASNIKENLMGKITQISVSNIECESLDYGKISDVEIPFFTGTSSDIYGDVNHDGIVDVADIATIISIMSGL